MLLDYCADCFKNLCGNCMEKGCCDNVPALSGQDEDHAHLDPEQDDD